MTNICPCITFIINYNYHWLIFVHFFFYIYHIESGHLKGFWYSWVEISFESSNQFWLPREVCSWINTILNSATLSINVNGKLNGFFKCKTDVTQRDPLSTLLFCIAEDVLSRNISRLVEQGKIELIKGTIHFQIPSHSLYADDIMIFFVKGRFPQLTL